MTTNILLGFPFGAVSIILHTLLLFVDTRKSYRFYNVSLLLWLIGNFMWMTIEFTDTNPSSNVHFGPVVPLGGVSPEMISFMTNCKTVLFVIGVIVQIVLYSLMLGKILPVPEQDDEDENTRREAQTLLCCCSSTGDDDNEDASPNDVYSPVSDSIFEGDEDGFNSNFDVNQYSSNIQLNHGGRNRYRDMVTLAVIENSFIIFWISKDMFWSFGTGDIAIKKNMVVVCEIIAMSCGVCAFLVSAFAAYIHRKHILRWLDYCTTVLWLSANYVWMCGEFFLRYRNLDFDDGDPGNDRDTRLVAMTLFLSAIVLQLSILSVRVYQWWVRPKELQPSSSSASISSSTSSNRNGNKAMLLDTGEPKAGVHAQVEGFGFNVQSVLVNVSPQYAVLSSTDDDNGVSL
jgi:hypothetical protein